MLRLLNESDDFARPLAGAGSRQTDGRAGREHRAQWVARGEARSRRGSIDRPIWPIQSLAHRNLMRGIDGLGRFDREARRSRHATSFARGDMARKQWRLVRFEHVESRPRSRVDLYEPDGVG